MKKLMVTPQQRANALDARDNMWPSVPPRNVAPHLGHWRSEGDHRPYEKAHTCNTIACFGGWSTAWPAFIAQGLKASICGGPIIQDSDAVADDLLFGDEFMFYSRAGHPADQGFTGNDHELVTHRLNWLIKNSRVKGPQ